MLSENKAALIGVKATSKARLDIHTINRELYWNTKITNDSLSQEK